MSRPLIIVFCLLPLYWAYLVFSTQPIVIYDATEYDRFGRLIFEKGWAGYFRAGLNREPLFSFLISRAIEMTKGGTVPYAIHLKFYLLIFLSVAMIGTYQITRLMGAGRNISGLAALYIGISPVILNSTLWLWSEAASYPWVVWIIIFSVKLWRAIREERPWKSVVSTAGGLAGLFVIFTMVKAVAATMLVFYLIPFYIAFLSFAFRRHWRMLGRAAVAVGIILAIMGAAVHGYKSLNQHYNGRYELVNRGDYALYGNTFRRLQPVNRDRVFQALLSVPRLGLCEHFYGNECVFWSYVESDLIFSRARDNLTARGLNAEQISKFFVSNSIELMAGHPVQQAFFMIIEASKMLFWENRLYFVKYPAWLAKVYSQPVLINMLCFGWALLSLAGVLCAILYLFGWLRAKNRVDGEKRFATRLFTFWFIACFSGLYSFYFIDIRYAFPIAPLFVALLAVCLGRLRDI